MFLTKLAGFILVLAIIFGGLYGFFARPLVLLDHLLQDGRVTSVEVLEVIVTIIVTLVIELILFRLVQLLPEE